MMNKIHSVEFKHDSAGFAQRRYDTAAVGLGCCCSPLFATCTRPSIDDRMSGPDNPLEIWLASLAESARLAGLQLRHPGKSYLGVHPDPNDDRRADA